MVFESSLPFHVDNAYAEITIIWQLPIESHLTPNKQINANFLPVSLHDTSGTEEIKTIAF